MLAETLYKTYVTHVSCAAEPNREKGAVEHIKPSHKFWVSAVGIRLRNLIENQIALLQTVTLT